MKKTIALLLVLVLLCTLSVSAFADGGIDFIDDPSEGDDIDPDGGDNPPSDNDDEDDDPAEPGPTGSDSTGELPEGSDPDGEPSISDLKARLSSLVESTMKSINFNRRLRDILSGPPLTVEGTSAKFDLKSGNIEKTLLIDTVRDLMDTRGIKDFSFTLNKVEYRISVGDLLKKMLDAGVSSIKFVVDGDKLNMVGTKVTKQGIESVTVDTLQPFAAEDSPAPSADAAKADTGKEEDADGKVAPGSGGSSDDIVNITDDADYGNDTFVGDDTGETLLGIVNITDDADDGKLTVKDNEVNITDDADDTVDVNVTGDADDGKDTVKDNEVSVTGKTADVNVTGNTPDGSAASGSSSSGSSAAATDPAASQSTASGSSATATDPAAAEDSEEDIINWAKDHGYIK